MKDTENIRAVDELGRIVLPIEMRRALDWGEGTPLALHVNTEAREITLHDYVNACTFCGATEHLIRMSALRANMCCPGCRKGGSRCQGTGSFLSKSITPGGIFRKMD